MVVNASDEKHRLEALSSFSHMMSVQSDEALSELAKLASVITQAPFAGVSLVDVAHVWIKGRFGVDLACLDREGAFCAAAVDSNQDVFIVQDAAKDSRFESNSLVANSPNVRHYSAATITSSRGYRLGTLWTMDIKPRDLQDLERNALQGLAAQAMHLLELRYADPLTKLPNRASFTDGLQKKFHDNRDTGAVVDCFVGALRVRNLRIVNSAYGFDVGNGMINSVANTLRLWAGDSGLLARLEDENFGFALFDTEAAALERVETLKGMLTAPVHVGSAMMRPIVSVGLAHYPTDGTSASSLLDQALAANQIVTEESAERPVSLSTGQRQSALFAVEFQRTLPDLLAQKQLVAHYQPQVDTLSRRILGLEALARVNHHSLGNIDASQFIPIAEQLGLIDQVDLAILNTVCADLRSWMDKGIAVVPVSVNVSQATLTQPGFADVLQAILQRHKISSSLLEVEITETGLTQWPQAAQAGVDDLHRLGVRVSLDDFGTGLSNLGTLQKFRIERLKADRSYVNGASSNVHVGGLLRLIHSVTQLFDIELICEGVEDEEDLRWACDLGCHIFQGWYFCKALNPAATEQLLIQLPRFDVSPERKRNPSLAAFLQSFY